MVGGQVKLEAEYKPLEPPLGIRHYFYLSPQSKIFANFAYVLNFNLSSSFSVRRFDNSDLQSPAIDPKNNFAFGLGYKYKDKFALEVRYHTPIELFEQSETWNSDFQNIAFILSYTLF
ncbi:MAG: hypothetical protein OHK0053_36450 [Microscillaceae bacterium]